MQEEDKIELRSEDFQEILGKVPPWILRWGITVIASIVGLLIIGSYLFRYPDIVQAEITITTLDPPVSILARSSGKIDQINTLNNTLVKKNDILGIIQNPATTYDVILLAEKMKEWEANRYDLDNIASLFTIGTLNLGSLQPAYASLQASMNDYINYKKTNYYIKKISYQEKQFYEQQEYYKHVVNQLPVITEQYKTSQTIFKRDSVLYLRKLIPEDEYDIARRTLLQNEQSHMSFSASIKQTEMQLTQGQENLLDLQQQAFEAESKYTLALQTAIEALNAQIKSWEQDYLLVSPIEGVVNYMGIWSHNQNVESGEVVFTIIPSQQDTPKGKALLSTYGAGKVKPNQRVNVRLNNFPDNEFGILIGYIISISNVPTPEGYYVLEIDFPKGLETNYCITLPISQQMHGKAEIITEDLRFIERFFMPVKKIIKEQQR